MPLNAGKADYARNVRNQKHQQHRSSGVLRLCPARVPNMLNEHSARTLRDLLPVLHPLARVPDTDKRTHVLDHEILRALRKAEHMLLDHLSITVLDARFGNLPGRALDDLVDRTGGIARNKPI